jgi:hypothetical protein
MDDAEVDPGDSFGSTWGRFLNGDLCRDLEEQTVRALQKRHGADLIVAIGQLARQAHDEWRSSPRDR